MCFINTEKFSVKTAMGGEDIKIYNYEEVVIHPCKIEEVVKLYNENYKYAEYAKRGVLVFGENGNIYLMIHDVLHAYHQHETDMREKAIWIGYERDGYIYISHRGKRLIREHMGSVV